MHCRAGLVFTEVLWVQHVLLALAARQPREQGCQDPFPPSGRLFSTPAWDGSLAPVLAGQLGGGALQAQSGIILQHQGHYSLWMSGLRQLK